MEPYEMNKMTINNKETLLENEKCVCGYCFKQFHVDKIKEWSDKEQTAICPHCHIDAVFPQTEQITEKKLTDFKETWFSSTFAPATDNENNFTL